MEGYTYHPLLMGPGVNKLDEIFEIIETDKSKAPPLADTITEHKLTVGTLCTVRGHASGYQSLRVRPTAAALKLIDENMLKIDYDTLHFECVIRDDGACLVVCSYGQIIGSRYLALIPASELDRFGWKED